MSRRSLDTVKGGRDRERLRSRDLLLAHAPLAHINHSERNSSRDERRLPVLMHFPAPNRGSGATGHARCRCKKKEKQNKSGGVAFAACAC
ncbi:hypothetical protein chiPu_0026619 [Chiloscyllium punctatum]|uniref:Uncharacterized protein n=1 Tax=Chiloscyllium punctatum TaxID=137246 RepID=A0A401TIX0_CHIPU|nr:hypothetical protein [Chiloscyllium punctatum]